MAQSFTEYLMAEGIINADEAALIPPDIPIGDGESGEESEGAKMLADTGLMTLEEANEALFFYRMNVFLDEHTIKLTQDNIKDDFFNEYLAIVTKGFNDYLNVKVTHGFIETVSEASEDVFIYQPLIGGDEKFIVGITASYDLLMKMARVMHKKLVSGLDLPDFEETNDDMLDFYSELINNINSSCSYKFNIDFDLLLPEYKENARLTAPVIYKANFFADDFTITVFLVNGKYEFNENFTA